MVLIGPAATFRQIMPFYVHTFPGGMTGLPFLVNHAVNWIENGVKFDPEFRRLFYLLLKNGKATNQVFPKVFTNDELTSTFHVLSQNNKCPEAYQKPFLP
jgi:hypothetical protein